MRLFSSLPFLLLHFRSSLRDYRLSMPPVGTCNLCIVVFSRRLETEINEKLQDVHNKLLQANVDQRESERDARMKETLATLQRIFPG